MQQILIYGWGSSFKEKTLEIEVNWKYLSILFH